MTARFIVGETRKVLAALPDQSVDLVLSSPPFLALRSYLPADHPDKPLEIGSEATPGEFIDTLLDVVEECARVLTSHGTLAFELGDTYSGSGGGGGDYLEGGMREGQQQFAGSAATMRESNAAHWRQKNAQREAWPLDKSLCLIPESFRWALVYGQNPFTGRTTPRWRARNVIRWCRPNPPVGALGDKFRPATSEMVVVCKSRTRWFDLDAVREPHKRIEEWREGQAASYRPSEDGYHKTRTNTLNPAGAPPLDWWEIPTQGYAGSHYATWPERLCVRPIEAMCPREVCTTCGEPRRRITEPDASYAEHLGSSWADRDDGRTKATGRERNSHSGQPVGDHIVAAKRDTVGWSDCGHGQFRRGIVLDPFGGSGTTAAVAEGLGRDSILIDLDARNADLARERVGMFLTVESAETCPGYIA